MFENRDPNLKREIRILPVNFIQTQPIIHTLFYKANVLVIAYFEPVVHLFFYPTFFNQNIKTHFRSHKARNK